ncbi:MAG: helix-turn-helix transcriptional regulator [Lachnospiraceae bacterium]|nr:helix-turn-helix transcriptional regulator [Lachnospiraceae bacterium]
MIFTIYEKIVSYCKKNNLSIHAFEKMCGIGNGTVGRWEGDKFKPSLPTLSKISKATGISVSELVKEDD